MRTETNRSTALREEIEALRHMTVGQLKDRYRDVFDEASRSNNKQFLFRRIAWRLQANAWGGLSDRARRRALELANDADLRVRAPKNFLKEELDQSRTIEARVGPTEDPRLPIPGTLLVRRYRGKDVVVRVRDDGFEYAGHMHRSLSSAVREATGTPWNGFAFFRLAASRGGSMAATSNGAAAPKPVRCAIYTRKSTEEGLNQAFNSLDAQREAAEAYILSQRHEGWTLVPTQYSDGGYTGANIERPGVRLLLADIGAGKVDCVVVYKVDRLSRSLIDFARMMELFEKHAVCFVSVTQQFNTNTPLGRLTLNILLSFAQFEREIISERTRDKQVAARKKGKWTGGHILLGYDLDSRAGKLAVNPDEAERIREMFRLYLEGAQVTEIVQRFDRLGWRNKQWMTQDGKLYGGSPLRRCHIYKLPGNILYTGRVKVGDQIFPGEHEAIIDQRTFELAQARLQANAWSSVNPRRAKTDALLRGMIYCSCCGSGMYSTYSANKERRYRYYVCYRAQQKLEGYCTSRTVSAPSVEDAVVESIRRVGVHPDVLAETARLARQQLADAISGLREELNTANGRIKNLKSQLARLRNPEAARLAEIREQLAAGETRAEELRKEMLRREKQRVDEKELRRTMESFEEVWKAMNINEQRNFLGHLVEKVGYDGRTGKVTVSFKSAGVKELVQEAVR